LVAQIKIKFEKGGIFIANMLMEQAPKTCKTVLELLPFQGKVGHAMFSGQLLSTDIDTKLTKLENPRVYGLRPGDITLNIHHIPIQSPDGRLIPHEIHFIYGPMIVERDFGGYSPANFCAKITEDSLKELEKVARRIRTSGMEKVSIKR